MRALRVAALLGAVGLPAAAGHGREADLDVRQTAVRPTGPLASAGYRLVKEWDFKRKIRDLPTLRSEFHTRYIHNHGTLDHLLDEWTRFRDNDNHVFTPRGLALVARVPGELAPGKVESGMLRSRWTGLYGVVEGRIKVPSGRGVWAAFWLLSQDEGWPPEIDIFEIIDNGIDTTRHSIHSVHGKATGERLRYSKTNERKFYDRGADYAADFHVFAVEWTSDSVRHYVDGVVVADRAYRWRHDDGSEAGPAHILVSMSIGGQWAGAPSRETFPASLEVEYIRVFQR